MIRSRFLGLALTAVASTALVAVVTILQLVGCDSKDEPATSSTHETSCTNPHQTVCAAYADFELRCEGATQAERDSGLSECLNNPKTKSIPLTCAYAEGLAGCLATYNCAGQTDMCIWEGFMAAQPPSWDVAKMRDCLSGVITDEAACDAAIGGDARACLNRLEECIGGPYEGATNAPFSDDNCFSMAALTPEGTRSAVECLSLPCDDIVDCLHAAGTFSY